jgi:DNA-binding SARP family transcriptional activator
MVEFRLLGPVELRVGSCRSDAGLPRQRVVLAALLVDAGRVVPAPTLIDRVWGAAAPPSARRTLHSYITRLRRILALLDDGAGGPRLAYRSGGYLLDVEPASIDLHRFRGLCRRARALERGHPAALVLWREAIGLRRGQPLTGLPGDWAERMRASWTREQLTAAASWAEAELAAGQPESVLAPLSDLAGDHPLAESLAGPLMRALCAVGRPAEALDVYHGLRQRLAAEVGTDPDQDLQRLYRDILRGEQAHAATPSREAGSAAVLSPRQLPATTPAFTGREASSARSSGAVRGRPGASRRSARRCA